MQNPQKIKQFEESAWSIYEQGMLDYMSIVENIVAKYVNDEYALMIQKILDSAQIRFEIGLEI